MIQTNAIISFSSVAILRLFSDSGKRFWKMILFRLALKNIHQFPQKHRDS
jgi:hypothetical protein